MSSHPVRIGALVFALCVTVSIASTSCASTDIQYVDENAAYTFESVESLAEEVDPPRFAGEPTSEADSLRQQRLVDLRTVSDGGAELAALLTDQFPDEKRSVPYYAEEATVNGAPAWIVLEVWGAEGGTLEDTRLWVFERASGRVMLSATFN